jgi:CTP synthase
VPKLAFFCNIRQSAVVLARDVSNIYEVPLAYHDEGLDSEVVRHFGLADTTPDLSRWKRICHVVANPEGEVNIAIVGKYTSLQDSYKSLGEALVHGGIANGVKVNIDWIDSELFEQEDAAIQSLQHVSGILVPGGFGERGTEGMIKAVTYSREQNVPFLGICLGMQMAVIETSRNLAQIENAGSEEFDHEANKKRFTPVIYHLKEWVEGNRTIKRDATDDKGGTMRLGAYNAILKKNSVISKIYGNNSISERHRHRYEVDLKFKDKLEACGLSFSGMSPDDRLPEIVEMKNHPWFIGVQFHPELKSKPFEPHPLFADFIRAAVERSKPVS